MPAGVTRAQVKVWYGDGRKAVSPDLRDSGSRLLDWWTQLPGTDVQLLGVFYGETYSIVKQDGYDEAGHPVNQRQEWEHYVDLLRGTDYYWYDPIADVFGAADRVAEIPDGAHILRASAMADADWFALYNIAKEDRRLD